MRPIFSPELVNDPFGDPGLYLDFKFEKRALLFDLGDLAALPPKKILRISDVFVSHTHMDHFFGFDRLLRICLGRDTAMRLYGPPGFAAQVEHKLAAYTWNLVENYPGDFAVDIWEIDPAWHARGARLRCHTRFRREPLEERQLHDGVLLDEPACRVSGPRYCLPRLRGRGEDPHQRVEEPACRTRASGRSVAEGTQGRGDAECAR